MIGSFKDRRLKRLYEAGDRSKLTPEHVERIENILARLDAATSAEDMNLPGFRLHPLKGDLKGFWSVTVRANWRIVFRFENGAAFDVELTDYH
jgi:proteic killer suppression protein